MTPTEMTDELVEAESLLAAQEVDAAVEMLSRLAEDAEEYVDRNCPTTEETQWFSFPTMFERLAYRRVEKDPRELRDVGEPLDRLYADLAFAEVAAGDYDRAIEALKCAVRWNPMGCGYRLDLAELFRNAGNEQECLALSYSVFERASDVRHLVRAFVNFARFWQVAGEHELAAAALRCARRLGSPDATLSELLEHAAGTPDDPDGIDDERAQVVLGEQGLPDGANAEIAICLIMCATDAADAGQRDLATALTLRARDLVGVSAASALIQLVREGDSSRDSRDSGDAGATGADSAVPGDGGGDDAQA